LSTILKLRKDVTEDEVCRPMFPAMALMTGINKTNVKCFESKSWWYSFYKRELAIRAIVIVDMTKNKAVAQLDAELSNLHEDHTK
jgi:hypothetical protein